MELHIWFGKYISIWQLLFLMYLPKVEKVV